MKNPKHIAIIMDGNGRWASKRNHPRIYGHIRGGQIGRQIITTAAKQKLQYLTLFAFSTENWNRPKEELDILMKLLNKYLVKETSTMIQNSIHLRCIGHIEKFPGYIQERLKEAMEKTKKCQGMTLTLALNYGGRQEIHTAIKKIIKDVLIGKISIESVNEGIIDHYLETHFLPNPDIIIRTGGQQRLSNFLLWKASYAELFFIKKFWPNFSVQDFNDIIEAYQNRQRRFGSINSRISPSYLDWSVHQ